MSKVLIVSARFYDDITDGLIEGAETYLKAQNLSYEHVEVPGALEIPAAIAFAMKNKKYKGFVALGCVIRGETSHYDTVCNESARGLMELSIKAYAPIGNGILTVENHDQAWERASVDKKNKGAGAAAACCEMMRIKKQFK